MQSVVRKLSLVVIALVTVSLMTGCTNWKKKYSGLEVEHQNLRGMYERESAEKSRLADQLAQEQALIDQLQAQIAQNKQTPAKATGFGDFEDVKFDAKAGTVTVTLPDQVLFDSGKAELKKNVELGKIVKVIEDKYNGKMVDVIGHTDADPIKKSKWKDNWELSSQRALAVTRYFVSHGLKDDQVRAVGRGSSAPVASNKTSSGKAKNRRVEIVVHIRSAEKAA